MSFDSDFYVTVAQILPVLLLALSLEVGLESFFRSTVIVFDVLEQMRDEGNPEEVKQTDEYLVNWSRRERRRRLRIRLALTGGLILSVLAEALALVALTLSDPPSAMGIALLVVIALVLSLLVVGLHARIWAPTPLDARINQHDPP